ncbi:MAG: HEAT repeat domain-containing protein [Bacteroidales bacterium]|nr:HEAT repeat domain-containing protein [Bacteroidales bacterium]
MSTPTPDQPGRRPPLPANMQGPPRVPTRSSRPVPPPIPSSQLQPELTPPNIPEPPTPAPPPLPPQFAEPTRSSGFAIVGFIVLGLGMLALAGGGAVLYLKSEKSVAIVEDAGKSTTPPTAATTQTATAGASGTAAESVTQPLKGPQIYKQLLKSTVFILHQDDRSISAGSGFLVHGPRKWVLTNFHVVDDQKRVQVFFPTFVNDELVTEPKYYVDHQDDIGRMGRVISTSREKDLAVVELDSVPEWAVPVSLSTRSAEVGSTLYSIGASGIELKDLSGTLWRMSTGEVRARSKRVVKFPDQVVDATLLESQKPINSGDSGGPSVNQYGVLVGVVSMSDPRRDSVKFDIDLQEVQNFLTDCSRRSGWTWDGPVADSVTPENEEDIRAKVLADLASDDAEKRRRAVRKIARLGSEARQLLPLLIEHLEDADPQVRSAIIHTIEGTWPPHKSDIALYESLLRKGGNTARMVAVKLYARHAELRIPEALFTPVLDELVEKDTSRQIHAIRALSQQGQAAKPIALRAILQAAQAESADVADPAFALLEKWSPMTASDVPVLSSALTAAKASIRKFAVTQLAPLAPDAPTALKWFLPLLEDTEPAIVLAAMEGLTRWGKESRDALTQFVKLADARDASIAVAALQAVEKTGMPEDLLALLVKKAAANDSPITVRKSAAERILALPSVETETGLPSVAPLTAFPDSSIRIAALQRLASYKKGARPMLSRIVDRLGDNEEAVQLAALAALQDVGPDPTHLEPVAALIGEDRSESVALAAIKTLNQIGPKSVDLLARLLTQKQPATIARAIVEQLGKFGPDAQAAIPEILAALDRAGHPFGELRLMQLAEVDKGNAWTPDPASDALTRIGGDKLADAVAPLSEWEFKTIGGRKIKQAKRAPNLGIQFWAVAVLANIDPKTLSAERRKSIKERLGLLAKYDPNAIVKQMAVHGLSKY